MKEYYYTEEQIRDMKSLGRYSQFMCKRDLNQHVICGPDMHIAKVKVFCKDKIYFAEKNNSNNKYYIHTPFDMKYCDEDWFKDNFIEIEEIIDSKINNILK